MRSHYLPEKGETWAFSGCSREGERLPCPGEGAFGVGTGKAWGGRIHSVEVGIGTGKIGKSHSVEVRPVDGSFREIDLSVSEGSIPALVVLGWEAPSLKTSDTHGVRSRHRH